MAASTQRPRPAVERIGRYVVYDEIAAGGMATVHLGRLLGPVGFSRTVAVKRLHAHLGRDPEFVAMFLDEARLAARIRHPNVGATIDIVADDDQLVLIMDYVHGASLSQLLRSERHVGRGIPPRIVSGVLVGVLSGLHAAHETRSESGTLLEIVHRDVSPQNIMVGVDGVARVLDFGIAKAAWNGVTTRDGRLKGKLSYMSPEQVRGDKLDRRTDVYAAAVVLWEALTGTRLFPGDNPVLIGRDILEKDVPAPSTLVEGLDKALDDLLRQGLSRDKRERFSTARAMAMALETSVPPATAREIGEWVEANAGPQLEQRAELVRRIESPFGAEPSHLGAATPSEGERPSQMSTHIDGLSPSPAGGGHEIIEAASLAAQVSQADAGASLPDLPAGGPRSRLVLAAAAVLGVVTLFLAWGLLVRGDVAGVPAPVRVAATSSDAAATSNLPPPNAKATTSASGAGTERGTDPPSLTSSAASADPVGSSERAPASSAAPRSPKPRPPPGRKPGCTPPFVLEAGIKRYKPECLE
jgi:eukaryotic-like serine/threonine-protein kinase